MSTVAMNHSECFVSVHTDMFVAIIEQCIDEDGRWLVKEIAEHTGIYGSGVGGGKCFITLSVLPTLVHVTIN